MRPWSGAVQRVRLTVAPDRCWCPRCARWFFRLPPAESKGVEKSFFDLSFQGVSLGGAR